MKLNKSQEEAMELLKTLAKEDRINMEELFVLMKAIYENETETITIPSTTPYIPSIPYEPWKPNTPWYEPYKTTPAVPNTPWYDQPYTITCGDANTAQADPNRKTLVYCGFPMFTTSIS